MAITDYKITDNEINTYNVKSAPDTLTSNAQSNKNWFDRLGEYFISKYNSLLDFIQGDFVSVDEVGAGLAYRNALEWKHALQKNTMIANYSGNITAITTGYRTIIANVTGLTTDDFMDCIMNINGTDYQCADAYESGDYATTTCDVEGVEVTITYSLSGGDITLTHTQNPLDTLYWNIQMFSTVADKIPAKSLPGNISNNAYIEVTQNGKWRNVALSRDDLPNEELVDAQISQAVYVPANDYSSIGLTSVVAENTTVWVYVEGDRIGATANLTYDVNETTLSIEGTEVTVTFDNSTGNIVDLSTNASTDKSYDVTVQWQYAVPTTGMYTPVMRSREADTAYLASATSVVSTALLEGAIDIYRTTIEHGNVPASGTYGSRVSVEREGYTPIGVVGFSIYDDNNRVRLSKVEIVNRTTLSYDVTNGTSSATTGCLITAAVLYIKNA